MVNLILLAVVALNGCGSPTPAPGDTGGTPVDPTAPVVASIEMTATKYSVTTTGTDESTVTVYAKDASGAAMTAANINISTSKGLISAPIVTTDATGKGTFTFTAGSEKTNQVAAITASSGGANKSLPISITGTTLTLTASKTSTQQADPTPIVLTGLVRDAGGSAVVGASLTLTSFLGNSFTAVSGSGTTLTLTSDATGSISATYNGNILGDDIVTLAGMGVQKTQNIRISNSLFAFEALLPDNVVAIGASRTLTVNWINADGSAHVGGVVNFTNSSSGSLTLPTVVDGTGKATVLFTAGLTASPDVVTARSADLTLSAQVTLDVRATTAARIDVQVTPSTIAPSVGALTSTATVTATVRDGTNNAVAGKIVNFRLLSGPGGGEYVSPGSAVTNAGGEATTTFYGGSSTSGQDGVVIEATVDGKTNTTTLTIGQVAAQISIGTTNKISKKTVGGLEVGYELPFSVTVIDSNSNAVPGATVYLGLYPVRFYTGTVALGKTGKFANEDLNRNSFLDTGEDGAVGEYPVGGPLAVWDNGSEGQAATLNSSTPGNGNLDPTAVASIPLFITTDATGMGAFKVTYAKSYGNWVDVEITASTQIVGGSGSSASLVSPLKVMDGDIPYPDSPFGY